MFKKKDKKNTDNLKPKRKESLLLVLRKKWLVDGTKTLLIIAILFTSYISLNLWARQTDILPEIDFTENKIYTLSDTSKKALKDIDQDVKIYAYGYKEDSNFIRLLKQYHKANEKISYELLTDESNYDMVKEYNLEPGYTIVILQSGDSKKIIDASSEFHTYDNTTYESIDITEQAMTNSILSLNVENKPKIYFLQGHEEYSANYLKVLYTYLKNEAFETATIDLSTSGSVPEDCSVLAILAPSKDILEIEKDAIKNYINNGGNIYVGMDVLSKSVSLPNLQSVLDEFGVSVKNGYIIESETNNYISGTPNIIRPQISSSNKITSDIYTDSYMCLAYSAKLQFQSDEILQSLNVTKETLLSSSETAAFTTNTEVDLNTILTNPDRVNLEVGSADIASLVTKTIHGTEDGAENKNSELIIVACANFVSDYSIDSSGSRPLATVGSNKDFIINSLAYLGKKENTITIRKDMGTSTYLPTQTEHYVIMAIILLVPVLIILIGIIIWQNRKKRK